MQKALREVEARFHRAQRDAEDVGDVLIGEPLQVSQNDGHAIVIRKPIDGLTDQTLTLLGFEHQRRIIDGGEGRNLGILGRRTSDVLADGGH